MIKLFLKATLFFVVSCLLAIQQVTAADSEKRIVSLDLCTDWMLLKYASQSQVVTYSPLLYRYQPDWVPDKLPVHDGSLEQLLELNPDLIISGEFNATLLVKRLRLLGKKVEIMPLPNSLQSILDYTERFKSLITVRPELMESIGFKHFENSDKSLLLLGANGIGTGKATLENDIIEKSGWKNYIQKNGFVSLDLEKIVHQPPDAVYWSRPETNSLANLFAGHSVLHGLMNEKSIPVSESWRWQCPGPWTFELIDELASWKKF